MEEHGQQAYAEFVRLSCRLVREELPRNERTILGQQRFKLWKQVLAENAPAFDGNPLSMDHFPRGICAPALTVEAAVFIKTSDHWWPLICPRELTLSGLDGSERELANATYLSRVTCLRLACRKQYDHGIDQWAYGPTDAWVIRAMAASPFLAAVRRLTVDSVRATDSVLTALKSSTLCSRLAELHIIVRLDDEEDVSLSAVQDPPGDGIAAAISTFLTNYRRRLVADPPSPPTAAV
ncbi:MAG TPA: hypothetical protein VM533_14330 [Fimbriiglobus sp.]|jgi:hypothetical protein|nr:hypothetical protein [Fimbriiglobus sp.]